jgi:hypothetical protein
MMLSCPCESNEHLHVHVLPSTMIVLQIVDAAVCSQGGEACLASAFEGGHLDILKHLIKVGGKELLLLRRWVST